MSETATKSRRGIGGPKTPEGKARVKLNAFKMGLYARAEEAQKVVAEAIGVTFDDIHQQMRDYYQPTDPVEETLVRRIARCSWRFLIYEKMEDFRFMNKRNASKIGEHLERLSIMERRTDVQLHRAIQALAAKRKDERTEREEKLKNKLLHGLGHLNAPNPQPPPTTPCETTADGHDDLPGFQVPVCPASSDDPGEQAGDIDTIPRTRIDSSTQETSQTSQTFVHFAGTAAIMRE